MFTRTAYELKNGSRRTVLPTRELAENLKSADPQTWRYARIAPTEVSWFRPGFGKVETFAVRTPRVKKTVATETPLLEGTPASPLPKRGPGRPRKVQSDVRGIAPANPTAPPTAPSPSASSDEQAGLSLV